MERQMTATTTAARSWATGPSGPMFRPPQKEDRKISLGDRIFVRVSMMSGETLEFVLTTVCGISEVIGEVRRRARHLCGLATLWIRNISWGWATQRPLRLYGSKWNPDAPDGQRRYSLTSTVAAPVRLTGPWDTH